MARLFDTVKGLRVPRSAFNLSFDKAFDCEMGQLIPIMCEEVVPGDRFKIGNEMVIRFQPTVAPIPDEIVAKVDYFQVPNRLIFNDEIDGVGNNWETFITKGFDGDSTVPLPRWNVTKNGVCSLWDYFGFPTGIVPRGNSAPLAFSKRAYNLVFNEFYRDENLQEEVDLDSEDVLYTNWSKDYLTSALLEQQRGPATALPVNTTVTFDDEDLTGYIYTEKSVPFSVPSGYTQTNAVHSLKGSAGGRANWQADFPSTSSSSHKIETSALTVKTSSGQLQDHLDAVSTAFNVSELRLAFQIQKWQERNARGGVRYTEFLQSHFGVHPRDDRLQRPQYLGGTRTPIITSEVLQHSESEATPLGTYAGKMMTADSNYVDTVNVVEYGWIIGILRIMPKARYTQGINRQHLRTSPFDYYFPEFANLSEQAIYNAEVFAGDDEDTNLGVWGYQGRFDEMRYKPSQICGNLRGNLDYWTLARKFETLPNLNGDFVKCVPSKRIFAVQSSETPACIVNFYNRIKALRPMPYIAQPGLIDHN